MPPPRSHKDSLPPKLKIKKITDSICRSDPARFFRDELFFLFGRLAGPGGHFARSAKDL